MEFRRYGRWKQSDKKDIRDPNRVYRKNNNQNTYQKLINKKYNFDFIVIDSFSNNYAIPKKLAGVGYARKIGLDFSLSYISNNKAILCCLDADTLISKDYLKKVM